MEYWIGAFGVSILSSLYFKKQKNFEKQKAEQILSQRQWKVDEIYQDAVRSFEELGKESKNMDRDLKMYKNQILAGYLQSNSPLSINGVNKDCLLIIEAESKENLAKMSGLKTRKDGNYSNLYNLFSRKRDQPLDNSLRVITCKDLVVSNGVNSLYSYKIDLKQDFFSKAFVENFFSSNSKKIEQKMLQNQNVSITKKVNPTGGQPNVDEHIIPSVLSLLTTMQFPFYSESGISICKNSFKMGIKTNISVWLYCNLNLNTLNGTLGFDESHVKLFFSWKDLQNYINNGASNKAFWEGLFFWVSITIGGVIAYKIYQKRKEQHERPAN